MSAPLTSRLCVEVRGLRKHFPVRVGLLGALLGRKKGLVVRAVDGVDLSIREGESLGIAGESGCGKTTLGMTLLRLYEPTGGAILFEGQDVIPMRGETLKAFRKKAQIIFQDPYASLNPRLTVLDTVEEPLRIHGTGRGDRVPRVVQALERAQLPAQSSFLRRYPHELSGGQRQRVAIARAIVLEPRFIVADEPVSMLDVSIRAGLIELLTDLANTMGLTLLYISHDLSTIRYICGRTAVMYLGKIVEMAPTEDLLRLPKHPYSEALVSAIPVPDPSRRLERVRIAGDVPSATHIPAGCRFRTRCPKAMDRCAEAEPALKEVAPGHAVACYLFHDEEEKKPSRE